MKTLFTYLIIFSYSITYANNKDIVETKPIWIENKSFDILVKSIIDKKEENNTLWNILLGAAITLVTTLLIEKYKSWKEDKIRKIELISKGQAKVYLIAQILKDLAMYKVHKQYYIRACKINYTDDLYNKQYEKGQEQRLTEAKLDVNISEYLQIVSEYISVSKNKIDFQSFFDKITNFTHPKSSKFESIETIAALTANLQNEEDNLNKEYKNLIDILNNTQSNMK